MKRYGMLILMIVICSLSVAWWFDFSIQDFNFFSEPPNENAIQNISPEEFQEMLSRAEKRHSERLESAGDTAYGAASGETRDIQKKASPDSRVRQRWRDEFDSSIVSLFRRINVIPSSSANDSVKFTTRTLEGDTRSLSDYEGQWLLLNFWATWCIPCRREMPSLNRLHEETDNLVVLGINVGESKSKIEPFIREHDINFPILFDKTTSIVSSFGTKFLPETWLIGPSVRVYGVIQGPRDWGSDKIQQLFSKLSENEQSKLSNSR